MAGLRSNRTSQRARYLARTIIDQSHSCARNHVEFTLAGSAVALRWGISDSLTDLISGAFWSTEPESPKFSIAILRRNEVRTLPSLEWAKPWIDAHQVMPAEITYPYRIMIDQPQGLIQVFDTVHNVGGIYIRHEQELDLRSFITPFRLMWNWVAHQFNAEIVHAASVELNRKGVLLSGASGSGKSTFAIHAALHGAEIIADDCTLVHESKLYPVFKRSKTLETTLQLIDSPALAGSLSAKRITSDHMTSAKSIIDLGDSPLSVTQETAFHSLIFPRVSPQCGAYRISPRQAVDRLTSDSLREIHGGSTRNRIRLARLARSVPSHRVLLPPDLDFGLDLVRRIVANDQADPPVNLTRRPGLAGCNRGNAPKHAGVAAIK